MEVKHLNLANLGGGAAVEKWGEELQRLAENVLDPNTEATDKRSITLKVSIKPTSERRDAAVIIEVSSKLATPIGVVTRAFFAKDVKSGQIIVGENNPNQMALDFDRAQRKATPVLVGQPATEETEDDR